jgi:DNA replication ATP-dependent helicase Dna2
MAIAQYTLSELSDKIRSAIAEELKVSSAGRPFKVTNILKQGGVLRLEVEPLDLRCGLDESMEDGRLGWNGETSGSADVISVLPDISYVNALMTSGRSPRKGSIVFINPAPFLEPLVKLWDRRQVAEGATRRYFELEADSHNPQLVPSHSRVSTLRPAQVAAIQLVGWNTSYLWGPPGTGKTSTVGWLLASYLCDRPIDRVLLLSTTNVAVDLAILSVDKAVPEVFGAAPKPSCLRFGSRFDPKSYSGLGHLIPVRDMSLLVRYEEHLHAAPDPAEFFEQAAQ